MHQAYGHKPVRRSVEDIKNGPAVLFFPVGDCDNSSCCIGSKVHTHTHSQTHIHKGEWQTNCQNVQKM